MASFEPPAGTLETLVLDSNGVDILRFTLDTHVGERPARRMGYTLPGLSGQGSVFFGDDPVAITLRVLAEFVNLAAIGLFEGKLNSYRRGGPRFIYHDENGRNFEHCELRSWTPAADSPCLVGGGGGQWLWDATLNLTWMQPS
ncbi:hypothetical protein RAS1_09320 [Phycisphaerae bacterium RAS1]|nr:hypothetical protein RAS1_09320 [Phycisphaerae bacterium RAS1]